MGARNMTENETKTKNLFSTILILVATVFSGYNLYMSDSGALPFSAVCVNAMVVFFLLGSGYYAYIKSEAAEKARSACKKQKYREGYNKGYDTGYADACSDCEDIYSFGEEEVEEYDT